MTTKIAKDQVDAGFSVYVTEERFGAQGDYETSGFDSSDAFAAAVAAIPANPTLPDQSGIINVPAGNFFLGYGVDLLSDSGSIGLVGAGQGATNIIIADDIVGLDNVGHIVRDVQLWSKSCWDASVAAGSVSLVARDTKGRGMWVEGRCRIERVTAYGFGQQGCYIPRMTNGTIDTNRFTNCGTGIYNEGIITSSRQLGSDAVADTFTVSIYPSGTRTIIRNGVDKLVFGVDYTEPTTTTVLMTTTPVATDTFRFLINTVSTTSKITNCYASVCDIGYQLDDFDHSVYDNNIAEGCNEGLLATSSFSTVWSKLYFEKNITTDYGFVNAYPVVLGTISIASKPTPATSYNSYNASAPASTMGSTFVEQDRLASTGLGMLSYDNVASPDKGLKYNQFKMTGANTRFRGLRVLDRDTASGTLDAVGTFSLVNGAKAAHKATVVVKSDGTVIRGDDFLTVAREALGEYSLTFGSNVFVDHASITPYQVYATGTSKVLSGSPAYTSSNRNNYENGNVNAMSIMYVTIEDNAGTRTDSGFTASIEFNLSDDLTS